MADIYFALINQKNVKQLKQNTKNQLKILLKLHRLGYKFAKNGKLNKELHHFQFQIIL